MLNGKATIASTTQTMQLPISPKKDMLLLPSLNGKTGSIG